MAKEDDKRRVFIYGDMPSPFSTTGNAKVIRAMIDSFNEGNYEVYSLSRSHTDIIKAIDLESESAYNPTEGFRDNSYIQLPCPYTIGRGSMAFNNRVKNHLDTYGPPHYLILQGDPTYLNLDMGAFGLRDGKIVCYVTIDSINLLTGSHRVLKNADHVITTSHFGKEQLEAEGFDDVDVIHEFVDTDKYVPVDEEKKKEIREEFGLDKDQFIIFSYFRNTSRKNPMTLLDSLYKFLMENEDAMAVLLVPEFDAKYNGNTGQWSTQWANNLGDQTRRVLLKKYGENLVANNRVVFLGYCNNCKGIKFDSNERFCYDCAEEYKQKFDTRMPTGLGVPEEEVIKLIQMSDLGLFTTNAEGFGLFNLEFASCGVPHIVPDNTTAPELVADERQLIETLPPQWVEQCGMQEKTTTDKVYEKLVEFYEDEDLRREISRKGREKAMEFTREKFVKAWNQWLEEHPVNYELKAKDTGPNKTIKKVDME